MVRALEFVSHWRKVEDLNTYNFSPWGRWPEGGLAIFSPRLKLDYVQLQRAVLRVESELHDRGITAKDLVRIELNDPLAWIATLALMRMGVPSMGASGFEQAVLPDVILGSAQFDLDPVARKVLFDVRWLELENESRGTPDVPEVSRPSENQLVRLILTSGTSGGAKAVGATFSDVQRRTDFQRSYWNGFDHTLDLMGLGSTAGFYTALTSFLNGNPYYTMRPSVKGFLPVIASQPIELISGSPIQIKELIAALQATGLNFPNLRVIRLSGAASPDLLMETIEKQFPGVEIDILYGSTEGGGVTRKRHTSGESTMNVGLPLEGVDLQIVDDEGNSLGTEVEGRVRYRTPGLIAGYWRQDHHTDENFVDGYFYPGDRGFLDTKGALVLVGRESEHVNLGGEKVNLQDYDRLAMREPGVEDAASFVVQDTSGLNSINLAYVGAPSVAKRLESRMMSRFGAERPSRIHQVIEIPRNSNGKVDRKELAKLVEGRAKQVT